MNGWVRLSNLGGPGPVSMIYDKKLLILPANLHACVATRLGKNAVTLSLISYHSVRVRGVHQRPCDGKSSRTGPRLILSTQQAASNMPEIGP